MTSSIPISDRLLRSIKNMRPVDPELVRSFETGAYPTRGPSKGPTTVVRRAFSRFISNATRPHATSPDRAKSCKRRRKLGGSSCMPDDIRELYTEGERAGLWVVTQEVKKQGKCELRIDDIAARAGVSRTTVQNAIRKAKHRDQQHISVEYRPGVAGRLSFTNVIRIVSSAWLRWLDAIKGGFKGMCPSKIKPEKLSLNEREDSPEGALERDRAVGSECNGSAACAIDLLTPGQEALTAWKVGHAMPQAPREGLLRHRLHAYGG